MAGGTDVAEPRRQAADRHELLVALVNEQRADGSWPWNERLLGLLEELTGRDRDEALALVAGLGLEPDLAERVAPTLLVLGLLLRTFAELEGQWRLPADKALAWLAAQGVAAPAGAAPAEAAGTTVADWMAARLAG